MDFSIFVYKILLSMNIEIDDELMKKALKYSKLKTKKEVRGLNYYPYAEK